MKRFRPKTIGVTYDKFMAYKSVDPKTVQYLDMTVNEVAAEFYCRKNNRKICADLKK